MTLQKISKQNLIKNGGNLKFTYKEMLKILKKHKINYQTDILKYNNKTIGYVLYCEQNNAIQISQICLAKNYQGRGIADIFIKQLETKYQNKNLTCDVYYSNINSYKFFTKNGFIFTNDDCKNRWRGIKYGY